MNTTYDSADGEQEVWTDDQTDLLLDIYCQGISMDRIARILNRTREAVIHRIQALSCNERSQTEEYRPRHRWLRSGKRFTENEKQIIFSHQERRIPVKETAKLLTRTVQEIEQFKMRHATANPHHPNLS